VSNYSLYSTQTRKRGTSSLVLRTTESNIHKPSKGGNLSQARQLIDDDEQHHDGVDTYNGKWKESMMYTTASYNDFTLLDVLNISLDTSK
jgi:hypothetical protein